MFKAAGSPPLFVIASLSLSLGVPAVLAQAPGSKQPHLGHQSAPLLTVDGLPFKDLNRNGKLDVYEDWRRSPEERADDLLKQMSIEALAGTLVHGTLPSTGGPNAAIGIGGDGYDLTKAQGLIGGKRITTFITRLSGEPAKIAAEANAIQAIAEEAPLGIPVTISTDPRIFARAGR